MAIDSALQAGQDVFTELTRLGSRLAGTEQERIAEQTMSRYFKQVGLDNVRTETFDFPGWTSTSSALNVDCKHTISLSEPHQIIALPGTPGGVTNSQIRDVGHGLPSDYEGKDVSGDIVLVLDGTPEGYDGWEHRMYRYGLAVEHGATGFVLASDIEGCLPRVGEIGYNRRSSPIPGVGISAEAGYRLRECCRETTPDATLQIEAHCSRRESSNVIGTVGPSSGPELVLGAHYDSHDISAGAVDNAFGCAVLVATAGLLDSERLVGPVSIVAFGAEEVGHFGANDYIQRRDPTNINCVINLDGIGYSAEPLLRYNGFTKMKEIIENVGARYGQIPECTQSLQLYGDQWPFCYRGIPSVMLGSVSENGRGWTHTHADTPDKTDTDYIGPLSEFTANSVETLVSEDLTHRSPVNTMNMLSDKQRLELQRVGRWPSAFVEIEE